MKRDHGHWPTMNFRRGLTSAALLCAAACGVSGGGNESVGAPREDGAGSAVLHRCELLSDAEGSQAGRENGVACGAPGIQRGVSPSGAKDNGKAGSGGKAAHESVGSAGKAGREGVAGTGAVSGSGGVAGSGGEAGGDGEGGSAGAPDPDHEPPIETECGDAIDNDHDGKLDCADVNCTGQICRPGSLDVPFGSIATHDAIWIMGPEASYEHDGETTIKIVNSPAGGTWAILEFGDVPADQAITVLKATLWINVETGGKPLQLVGSDDSILPSSEAPADPGPRSFDVTTEVQKWVSNTESRRKLTIRYGASRGSVLMRATEYGDSQGPRIDIYYQAACDFNGQCPAPTKS